MLIVDAKVKVLVYSGNSRNHCNHEISGSSNSVRVDRKLPQYTNKISMSVCEVCGVIFVLSVMRVVGGILVPVVCAFRFADVVCCCLLCTLLEF